MATDHVVYILYSPSVDRHYIGQSSDFTQRAKEHLAGHTPSTSHASDWKLVFLQKVPDLPSAMALERKIKRTKSRKSIARYIADQRNLVGQPLPLDQVVAPT